MSDAVILWLTAAAAVDGEREGEREVQVPKKTAKAKLEQMFVK